MFPKEMNRQDLAHSVIGDPLINTKTSNSNCLIILSVLELYSRQKHKNKAQNEVRLQSVYF